jgi:hypothetical protein
LEGSPIHNPVHSNENSIQSQCNVFLSWIERYYMDIPVLQSQVRVLKEQIDVLTNENHRLESLIQHKEKCNETTSRVICKNVEATTTIVNSTVS